MAKVRVYELAKELGSESKTLIAHLNEHRRVRQDGSLDDRGTGRPQGNRDIPREPQEDSVAAVLPRRQPRTPAAPAAPATPQRPQLGGTDLDARAPAPAPTAAEPTRPADRPGPRRRLRRPPSAPAAKTPSAPAAEAPSAPAATTPSAPAPAAPAARPERPCRPERRSAKRPAPPSRRRAASRLWWLGRHLRQARVPALRARATTPFAPSQGMRTGRDRSAAMALPESGVLASG